MAIRGRVTNSQGEVFDYSVEQYKMRNNDKLYKERSANFSRLDSNDIEWARIYVFSPDAPDDGIHTHFWGPYISQTVLDAELTFLMDDEGYREAVG